MNTMTRTEGVALRPVYNSDQFAAEILGGQRSARWVSNECRARRIKTVAKRPVLIPQSEAIRFITPSR